MMRALLMILALTLAPVSSAAQPEPADVVRRFFDAYRALDVERLVAVLSPAIVFDDPTARLHAEGHDQIRKLAQQVRASYKDIGIELHSLVAGGDHVAAEVTISAVVTKRDGSTGQIQVRGASFFRVRPGRIETWTDYFDVQTLNEQLRGGA